MAYSILTNSDWSRHFALCLFVSALLVVWPNSAAAQAAGNAGTNAGTPQGQGDAGAKKPQKKRTPQEVEEAIRKKKGNFKKSPKIKNTRWKDDPEVAALLAALEELKAGKSKGGSKPKGSSGDSTNAGGSTPGGGTQAGTNPTGANPTGGGGKASGGKTSAGTPTQPGIPGAGTPGTPGGGTPGTTAGKPPVGVATMATARAPVAVAPVTAPPSSGSNSSSSSAMSRMAVQPGVSNVLACGTKSVMIQSINGVGTGMTNPKIVFTPDPQYDDYKISGCNFGQSQGQVYLNGPFKAGQVQMQIQSWTDTEIEVKVAPNLTGEPDQNNVALVIAPSGNASARLQGCKFYAMRQEVTLSRFPQAQVTLASIVDDAGAPVTSVKYSSPYNGIGRQDQQSSGETFAGGVDRFNETRFNPQGTDVWDFSTLAPGFVPTQFSLGHWAGQCAEGGSPILVDDDTIYTDGQWGAQWDPGNPKRLIVNLAEWHCHASQSGDTSNSSYALEVQVSGPAGVNPWP